MSVNDLMVLRGRVGTNLILSRPESGEGKSFSRFRMVVPRSRRKDNGEWEEADPQWYTVRAWGSLAENMAMSLRKGNPVVVVGRPASHAWINKEGEVRSELAVHAFAGGHDLAFGASFYRRVLTAKTPAPEPGVEDTPSSGAVEPAPEGSDSAANDGDRTEEGGSTALTTDTETTDGQEERSEPDRAA